MGKKPITMVLSVSENFTVLHVMRMFANLNVFQIYAKLITVTMRYVRGKPYSG